MNPIDIKLFSRPSKEKTFKLLLSVVIIEFKFSIKLEKQISSPIRLLPISLIASDINEVKYINNSQIKKEQFIKIPKINNLKTNW